MWDLGHGGTEWGLDEGYAVGDDEGDRPDRPTDQLIQNPNPNRQPTI